MTKNVFFLLTAGAFVFATSCRNEPSPVERGRYLTTIMGCNDCHTPLKMGAKGPEPDMARMFSGHPESLKVTAPASLEGVWGLAATPTLTAWSGPWGVSFAANLTPDEETGIGAWDEQLFIRTMRTGKHLGAGRDLLPPMPWQWAGQTSDEDLRAIFAYLKSVPPIRNQVPPPLPPVSPAP